MSRAAQPVFLRVIGRRSLTSAAEAHQAFARLQARRPRWMPGAIDVEEPARYRYSPEAVDELWGDPGLTWFRPGRRPSSTLGSISPAAGPNRPASSIGLKLAETELDGGGEQALAGLLVDWAIDVDAIYGHLHLVTPDESGRAPRVGAHVVDGRPGLPFGSDSLTDGYIPDLYWLTVWGRPYVELFGRDRLAGAPAHRVTEIAPDLFLIQLTERLSDLRTDHPRLQTVRDKVKAHLQDKLALPLFYTPAHGPNRTYTTISIPWEADGV